MRPVPHSAFLATMRARRRHGGQGCALIPLRSRQHGFTLVELVLVIALAGVVAVMISAVLSRPLQGFVDQSRRAELTDQAATALNRMARDVRAAVPNSLRTADPLQLHLVPITAAGRYAANQPAGPGGVLRDPPACTQSGPLCEIEISGPIEPNKSSDPHWLIIYNTQAPTYDMEPPADVQHSGPVSPKNFKWENGKLDAELQKFSFNHASPQRRFFLANEVVGYRCTGVTAGGGGTLLRETFDTLDLTKLPTTRAPLADGVSSCNFTYQPGTHARQSLVTLRLSLSKGGETISLVQQVHINNAP
ncbi:MAG TPA: type II secretion system protein [Pseudomonas sp.]|nr:type II secretion system protein [Pseudomonas sp.]